MQLTPDETRRLLALVADHLATIEMPISEPFVGFSEVAFTAQIVTPSVRELVERIDVPGLHVSGEGAGPILYATMLGMRFHPDVAITLFGQQLVAVEVKILRSTGRQYAFATALGQSEIYLASGYGGVVTLLITERAIETDEIARTRALLETSKRKLVVRSHAGAYVAADRSWLT